jgi:hypothetical protein
MTYISEKMVNRIRKVAIITDVLNDILFRNRPILKDFDIENIEIDKEKQVFRNYKTGDGGDVVALVMKAYNLQYPDALLWLQKKYELVDDIPTFDEIAEESGKACNYYKEISKHYGVFFDENSFMDGFQAGVNFYKYFSED